MSNGFNTSIGFPLPQKSLFGFRLCLSTYTKSPTVAGVQCVALSRFFYAVALRSIFSVRLDSSATFRPCRAVRCVPWVLSRMRSDLLNHCPFGAVGFKFPLTVVRSVNSVSGFRLLAITWRCGGLVFFCNSPQALPSSQD